MTLSKAVRSFIDKQVARWVSAKSTASPDAAPRYHASFERVGRGHLVECRLEVWSGDQSWVGADYGVDPQEALRRCLEHMAALLRTPTPQKLAVAV